jgi:hypothetical protein
MKDGKMIPHLSVEDNKRTARTADVFRNQCMELFLACSVPDIECMSHTIDDNIDTSIACVHDGNRSPVSVAAQEVRNRCFARAGISNENKFDGKRSKRIFLVDLARRGWPEKRMRKQYQSQHRHCSTTLTV